MFSLRSRAREARDGSRLRNGVLASILVALVVAACENPQPPTTCGTIPQVTVNAGETSVVTACFNDPNGDMLTFTATSSNPGVATVSVSGTTITVSALAPGSASVTVTATDAGGLQAQLSFQVMVPNRAPLPRGTIPGMTVPAGETATVDASSYFSEPDGEALVYGAESSDPGIATVSVTGSSIVVTGAAKGITTVSVIATDPGGLSATQTFQATVPNRPPAAVGTIPEETVEVGEAVTVDLSSYFEDPDGDALRYTASPSGSGVVRTSVAGGILTVTGLAKGTTDVTVTATDSDGLSATQTFQATVPNRPPAPVSTIPEETVAVGDAVTVDLSSYFEDPDGDALRYTASSADSEVARVSVASGVLTIRAVAKGTAEVSITATDSEGLSATQTVQVTVPNRPPAPVGTIPEETVEVGEADTVDLSSYFEDPDGDALRYTASSSASGVVRTSVAGGTLTVTGVAKGTAEVTVTATDTEDLSATQSFQVAVANQPPAPVGRIRDETVAVGEAVTVRLSSYFEDPDGDALRYTARSSTSGVVQTSVAGSILTVTGVAKGTTDVTVTARDPEDQSATQTFEVTVPNRPAMPVGTIPAQSVETGGTTAIDASRYFIDPDGDALTFTASSSNTSVAGVSVSGSTVTITAVATGSARITILARDPDGLPAIQRASVTVEQANRAPQPVSTIPAQALNPGGTAAINAALYFTDPDGDALAYSATSSNTSVAGVSVSGSIVTITAVANGSATITITARDPGGLSATQRANVTVEQANRAPRPVGAIPAQTLNPGGTVAINASQYFTDPDGDALTYTATSSNTSAASVLVSGSTVTITAVATGSATITVTARDPGGLTATQRASVTVEQANRPPQPMGSIPAQTLSTGGTVAINAAQYFTDPDGDALAYTATSSNTSVATASVSGSIVTIAGVAVGSATITITARDPDGLSATQGASVTVEQGNRPPRAVGTIPPQRLSPGATRSINASQYFTDPDGDALTYTATSSRTSVATVSVSGSTVTIRGVATGSATITITARDPGGLTATQTTTVTVAAAPDLEFTNVAPTSVTAAPGQSFTVRFTIRNSGGAASAATTMRFYESDNATISTGDIEIGDAPFGALASGSSRTVSAEFTLSSAASGTLYLGSCVDPVSGESDTSNNCSPSVQVTVSSSGSPNLSFKGISPSSVSVNSGTSFQIRDILVNTGTLTSPPTTLRLFRSSDATISTGDTEFGTTVAVASLDPSEEIPVTGDITFTNTTGATVTVYVGFCVDVVEGETEEDQEDNCSNAVTVIVASAINAGSAASGSGAIEGEGKLVVPPGKDGTDVRVKGVRIRAMIDESPN